MPGHKHEADNAAARGWYRHMIMHARLCACGHPEWRHQGLNEPACTNLGTCPCPAFQAQMKETA